MKDTPKDLDRYLLIHNALKRAGKNQSDVARAMKIYPSCISAYMYGQKKSKRFDNWIKENLGIQL